MNALIFLMAISVTISAVLANGLKNAKDGEFEYVKDDNTLRVWDVATGELVAVHSLEANGSSVAVASDNRIVVGTSSGQLHFLTLQNYP